MSPKTLCNYAVFHTANCKRGGLHRITFHTPNFKIRNISLHYQYKNPTLGIWINSGIFSQMYERHGGNHDIH